jgi:SAM-dependent methyltransferase
MGRVSEPYHVTAKYYDGAYAAKNDLLDLPFYLDLATRSGGPVLELGCGTGRVSIPIARAGIAVHGVDRSRHMLGILKQRLQEESPEVRRRVALRLADMRRLRTPNKYPLVIIPFRPMQHMQTLEDQLGALATAASHLDKGGTLAFDVFFPKFDLLEKGLAEEMREMEWAVDSGRRRIVRYFRKDAVDKINQIFRFTFIFRTYEDEKLLCEESEPLSLSYYTYPHLQALFRLAGLQVVEQYGSFARTPLDNQAKEMIFLLRKGGTARATSRPLKRRLAKWSRSRK